MHFWKRYRKSAQALLFYAVIAIPMGEQAATLPKGRFMVSFMTLLGSVSSQYTSVGQGLAISEQFNRSISFSQIAEQDLTRQSQINGMLQSQGIASETNVGHFVGSFEGSMQAMIPLVGYGITDRVGIFATIPIIKIRAQYATAFEPSPEYKAANQHWIDTDQAGLATNISQALQTGFEQKITDAGYRYEPNSERTQLGDLQLVSPWILSETTDRLQYGIVNTASLPTGAPPRIDDLFGIGVGSGRFALGTGGVASYAALARLKFSSSLGAGINLPTHMAKRIPTTSEDMLALDSDPNTRLGWTPTFKAGFEMRFQISRSWATRVGYQYQIEANTPFTGDIYPQSRYDLLSQRSGQELHTLSAGLDFNLIQAFLDGDFLFPTQLAIAGSLPIAGRNTLADKTCLLQTSLFF